MLSATSCARALAALAVLLVCGCGDDDTGVPAGPKPIAVLSAFPAEMAPILSETTVEETLVVHDRLFRVGTLHGVRVVVGLTGIGLANATATTSALLDRLDVAGIVVSGVAGSPNRIADVTVPESWELMDGGIYPTDPGWYSVAGEVSINAPPLEHCADVPPVLSEDPVCLAHAPAIILGGVGRSEDGLADMPRPCIPDGDDVFGCDLPPPGIASLDAGGSQPGTPPLPGSQAETANTAAEPSAVDMESAAIARQAAERELPFIAFRAVSDGTGDPLNLPGFPAQFFAYYRLSAHNAAAAAIAFLERLPGGG